MNDSASQSSSKNEDSSPDVTKLAHLESDEEAIDLEERIEKLIQRHEKEVILRMDVIANNVIAGNSVSEADQKSFDYTNAIWLGNWPFHFSEDYASDANGGSLNAGNINQVGQDYIKKQFAKVSNGLFALAFMQDPPEILF